MEKSIVFVGGARTPFTKFGSHFKDISATDLAVIAATESLKRAQTSPNQIGHVVFGNAIQTSADAIYLARHVGLKSGVPYQVPAATVNRLCGSGFQAIVDGAKHLLLGEADFVLVGGTENMSQAPYAVRGARFGVPLGKTPKLEDILWEALNDSLAGCTMAITAENLAEKYKITRKEADEYALRSQQAAKEAIQSGKLAEEMVAVPIKGKAISQDEHPRFDTTLEGLGQLPAYFKEGGTVTAGNASGVCDGAAALVMTTEALAKDKKLPILGKLLSWGFAGVEPKIMGIGPVDASKAALKKAGLSLDQVDRVEVNEAFASQYLAVEKELGLDRKKTNVNGGAIALGHPLGASGARLTLTILYELRRSGKKHGLATGVGGIIRDILSVGARPIALLNSLRFGPLTNPASQRLFRSVVDGIQWYGNSIGIPTVGGEIDFHPAYSSNCLVNVMCIGIAPKEALLSSKAKPNCAVMILGSSTGRDGIGGCSVLASQEMREALSKRPTVQVGDPYFGKCLIEATLEAASLKLFVALKDMGAAGLTCTTSEMSAAGKCGMEVDVSKIPAREKGMEPWEFMMSESQERMLAAVDEKNTEKIREIFHKWGLEAEVIGKTIQEEVVKIFSRDQLVASLSTAALVDPPPIYPEIKKENRPTRTYKLPSFSDLKKTLLDFLATPSLVNKKWAWEQYDHMVQVNTVVGPGADAAVIRVHGKSWGIAVTMEGNGRYCKIDPKLGAQYLLAEALRNLTCVGATPLALTDGLNFGNPDKAESYSEFVEAMEGLVTGCQALKLPVVSGNVSFYNESEKERILPTPILGMVGKVANIQRIVPIAFQREGEKIYLVGPSNHDLSGSLFLEFLGIESDHLPPLSWETEKKISEALLKSTQTELLSSCHDVGQGGLFVSVAECAIQSGLGAKLDSNFSVEEWLSEAPSRYVVTVSPDKASLFEKLAEEETIAIQCLGVVGGSSLVFHGGLDIPISQLADVAENTLPRIMGNLNAS